MSQLHKANHYVPRLYLKQWAKKNKIFIHSFLVPNHNAPLWKEKTIKGIAFLPHLYTYFDGHQETDEFERWLDSTFESPAAEAIQRVIREERLHPEHWKRLVHFAAALDVRTPSRLKEFLSRQYKEMPAQLNSTLEHSIRKLKISGRHYGAPLKDSTPPDRLFPLKTSIEIQPDGSGLVKAKTIVGRKLWIWQMKHLLTNTIGLIPTNNWTILHTPTGVSWPTSDKPVIRLNFNSHSNYDLDGGWMVKNGNIILLLSPKHLLFTCIGKPRYQRGTILDQKTAQLLCKIIIENADNFIFSKEPFNVSHIRPRIACPETYESEKRAWKNWHPEQYEAEERLQY